jgi:DNA-binding MarR family transcriptional regulator
MNGLTPRQSQVKDIITLFYDREGYRPTIKDVSDAIGTSEYNARQIIDALIKKGVVTRRKGIARSLKCII